LKDLEEGLSTWREILIDGLNNVMMSFLPSLISRVNEILVKIPTGFSRNL